MDVSNVWFSATTTQSFTLPENASIELSCIYNSSGLFGIYKREPYGAVSLGIRKVLGDNGGALNLNFSDIFRTNIFRLSADVPQSDLVNSGVYDFDTRTVKLTYTKSFGNNKLKSRNKRQTGAEDDLKRVGN